MAVLVIIAVVVVVLAIGALFFGMVTVTYTSSHSMPPTTMPATAYAVPMTGPAPTTATGKTVLVPVTQPAESP